jgi:hypothetical protein
MATNNNQFYLKLVPNTFYDITINWGDGITETFKQNTNSDETLAGILHTYGQPGIYNISIFENSLNGFPKIWYNAGPEKTIHENNDFSKITSIVQWGNTKWNSLTGSFAGCSNLSAVAEDRGTNAVVNTTSLYETWNACFNLSNFGHLNTSNSTSFYSTWAECTALSVFPLLDSSKVENFGFAWWKCEGLKNFPLLNTSQVKTFYSAWAGCLSLTSFPLINTTNVLNFEQAWISCSSLKSFPILNTSKGTNFSYTWAFCSSLTSFPFIDTSNGTLFVGTWAYLQDPIAKSQGLTNPINFPALNLSKMVDGTSCFDGVTLTTQSYSALLTSLCATNMNTEVSFHGGDSKYNSSANQARIHLSKSIAEGGKGWTIIDGGLQL